MLNKQIAKVIITSSSKPPTLTVGTIMPEALCTFENACKNYLCNKEGLNPIDHVARVAGGFLDPLIYILRDEACEKPCERKCQNVA